LDEFFFFFFFLLSGLISCSKAAPKVKFDFKGIRQSPSFSEISEFTHHTTFHASKKPNIYFIFFDTLRHDLALKYGKNISKFYKNNFSFNRAYAAGTATVYSTYGLFHSNPAFLAYHAIPQVLADSNEYGSIYIKLLQQLGYQINSYGFYWGCVTAEAHEGSSWERFLISFFGWKSRLLERCQHPSNYDEVFNKDQDEITVRELKSKLPQVVTSPTGHFSILTFYNNHNPYRWGILGHEANPDVGEKEDIKNVTQTKNRYINSVRGSDKNFNEILEIIGLLPGHEEAVIVLFSDHGEMLYEKAHESYHGGVPWEEKNKTVLSFHFPENFLSHHHVDQHSLASIIDVFPTLVDYLGVTPALPSHLYAGRSLISQSRKSALIVQSSGENPTRNMVLENNDYKAWITVEEDDFYHSKSFTLTDITDTEDRPIPSHDKPCVGKTVDECKDWLNSQFSEAITELYPSSNYAVSNVLLEKTKRLPARSK